MDKNVKRRTSFRSSEHISKHILDLRIVHRRTDMLKPDPANPRRHSTKQIRQIARSIEAFGFVVPVLVDAELGVISGHGRLLPVVRLGLPKYRPSASIT